MSARSEDFDVIIVGAGHAGVEASLACARSGLNTLNVTTNLGRIAFMSCNPAIGGLAKGHMVRELDTLGGEMARATDASCIQFKRLNSKKGPAVRGSRAQCDKEIYSNYMFQVMNRQQDLDLLEAEVKCLALEKGSCKGVYLHDGSYISSRAVIITTGTFLNGIMHVGSQQISGGRVGDKASQGLSDQLLDFGFQVRRLKTGTPPRLSAKSINWEKTTPQKGDKTYLPFSFFSKNELALPQIECFLSYTNEKTHEVIRNNLHRSPLHSGIIEGLGPRYCPSIEDKITRFPDRIQHQTFLEPEGLGSESIYLQGISTSLPEDVQEEFLKTIPGLEEVKVLRAGYAVEYDFVEPTQIWHSLETRNIENLFLAGQINGTSGYEEAAAQGFLAGVNAVRKLGQQEPLILERDQAYMGVLVDDLVTKGTTEPYRMFTSRAEHRLVLREDNNIERLLDTAKSLCLLSHQQIGELEQLASRHQAYRKRLQDRRLVPTSETLQKLSAIPTAVIQKPTTLEELMRRKEFGSKEAKGFGVEPDADPRVCESVEIAIRYAGYIDRQLEFIRQARKFEQKSIPNDLDYSKVRGLSGEEIEKLSQVRPRTFGQAGRISGVNPSGIQALMVHVKGCFSESQNCL